MTKWHCNPWRDWFHVQVVVGPRRLDLSMLNGVRHHESSNVPLSLRVFSSLDSDVVDRSDFLIGEGSLANCSGQGGAYKRYPFFALCFPLLLSSCSFLLFLFPFISLSPDDSTTEDKTQHVNVRSQYLPYQIIKSFPPQSPDIQSEFLQCNTPGDPAELHDFKFKKQKEAAGPGVQIIVVVDLDFKFVEDVEEYEGQDGGCGYGIKVVHIDGLRNHGRVEWEGWLG